MNRCNGVVGQLGLRGEHGGPGTEGLPSNIPEQIGVGGELSYRGAFVSNSIYYIDEAVSHEGKIYFSTKDGNTSVPCEGNWTWPQLVTVDTSQSNLVVGTGEIAPPAIMPVTKEFSDWTGIFGAMTTVSLMLNIIILCALVHRIGPQLDEIRAYIFSKKAKKRKYE